MRLDLAAQWKRPFTDISDINYARHANLQQLFVLFCSFRPTSPPPPQTHMLIVKTTRNRENVRTRRYHLYLQYLMRYRAEWGYSDAKNEMQQVFNGTYTRIILY